MSKLKTLLLLAVMLPATASAGVWEERELLERYITQMEMLNQTLLVDAQLAADPKARISLNYPAVLHASNEIINKLKHHLASPLEEYRSLNINIETDKVATHDDK
ncbi:RAQPRD family integrative conjugative element protein [Vibrio sp.]|uniref:RAQPRD family integrative conjugative element protein n=1 Tax=Vibrio sp. TaxID=678 RepID=UPI003D1195CF